MHHSALAAWVAAASGNDDDSGATFSTCQQPLNVTGSDCKANALRVTEATTIDPFDLSNSFFHAIFLITSIELLSSFFLWISAVVRRWPVPNYSVSVRTSESQDAPFLLRSRKGTINIHSRFNNRYLLAPASIIGVDRTMFFSNSVLQDVLMLSLAALTNKNLSIHIKTLLNDGS